MNPIHRPIIWLRLERIPNNKIPKTIVHNGWVAFKTEAKLLVIFCSLKQISVHGIIVFSIPTANKGIKRIFPLKDLRKNGISTISVIAPKVDRKNATTKGLKSATKILKK